MLGTAALNLSQGARSRPGAFCVWARAGRRCARPRLHRGGQVRLQQRREAQAMTHVHTQADPGRPTEGRGEEATGGTSSSALVTLGQTHAPRVCMALGPALTGSPAPRTRSPGRLGDQPGSAHFPEVTATLPSPQGRPEARGGPGELWEGDQHTAGSRAVSQGISPKALPFKRCVPAAQFPWKQRGG